MSGKMTLGELAKLSFQPDNSRWVHPEEVNFESETTETSPNELLTDHWSDFLSSQMPKTGDVPVSQIVADIVELTERFGYSYTI